MKFTRSADLHNPYGLMYERLALIFDIKWMYTEIKTGWIFFVFAEFNANNRKHVWMIVFGF